MKVMKRKALSWLLVLTMVVSVIVPSNLAKADSEDAYDGYVYLTIEKSTIGQGLILEPVKVGYHNGDSIGDLIFETFGEENFKGSSSYVSGVKDGGDPEDWSVEDIPEVLYEYLDEMEMLDEERSSEDKTFLCQNDFAQYYSGWIFTVDDVAPSVGMNECELTAEDSGAVIRMQFTLTCGDVVGIDYSEWGYPLFCDEAPSKLTLIKKLADWNGRTELDRYQDALEVLADWEATEEDVEDAEDELDILDMTAYSDTYTEKLAAAQTYMLSTVESPAFGNEWLVLNIARSNIDKEAWYKTYLDSVKDKFTKNESAVLAANKSTENSRTIIALSAIGADVTNIAGYDITAPLADFTFVGKQGLNGSIYALIALDCKNYEIPSVEGEEKEQTTREKLIQKILDSELEDGGWTYFGDADPDMTGMAIQALAPYYNKNEDVKAAVDRALDWLSEVQNEDGSFASWGTVNAESCAQIICALSALGIDADQDERFVKNENSVVDALLSFYDDSTGGFKHVLTGKVNAMATQQAGYSLIAYDRFVNDKNTLYDMTDVICLYNKDHTWDEGKVTKEPTLEAEGEKTFNCERCGATKTEKIDKLVEKQPTTQSTKDDKKTETTQTTQTGVEQKTEANTEKTTEVKTEATTEVKSESVNVQKGKIKKVTSSKKKQIKITWKKLSKVTGYQIQVSTSSKFKKSKTKTYKVKGATKVSKTIKSLKSKKKYYVRIRGYKTTKKNGKSTNTYGTWSGKKSVTVK